MTQPATPPFDLDKTLDAFSRMNTSVDEIMVHRGAIVAEFERLRLSLASATTAPPLPAQQQRVVDDFARIIAARRIPAENWGELHDAWRMRAEKAEAALASAREDGARLDWLALHHYDAVSLAVGKAYPTQPLRDAIDSALDAARSDSKEEPHES